MDEIGVTLLGTPRVEARGAPVALPRRRTRALLYYLSTEPQAHSRDELADLLWPELDPAKARRQLSDALTDLRRTLGAASVRTDSETVCWTGADADVARFASRIALANRSSGQEAEQALAEAVGLYAGEFLAGIRIENSEPFDEWLQDCRLRLSLDALAALARRGWLQLERGDAAGAIEAAARGLALDMLREDLWRLKIEAMAAKGDRQGALQEYDRCRETLERELGVAPEAETEALRRRLAAEPGSPASGSRETIAVRARPPLPFALRLPPGALPLTGRDLEMGKLLRRWGEALAGRGGLVLIVGEAGIGKSRLAAEFAARATASGALVLGARCPDLAAAPPHGPFEEALRGALGHLPPGSLTALGDWLPWAGRLVPEIGLGAAVLENLPPEEERSRLAEAAGRLLEVIAAGRPLLLVLEDLHWAHPSTIALVHRLARRPWPAMILGTFRDTEPQTPGSTALSGVAADLASEARIERVTLGPLTEEAAASLVRTALSAAGSRIQTRPAARCPACRTPPTLRPRTDARADRGARRPGYSGDADGRHPDPGEARLRAGTAGAGDGRGLRRACLAGGACASGRSRSCRRSADRGDRRIAGAPPVEARAGQDLPRYRITRASGRRCLRLALIAAPTRAPRAGRGRP